VPVPPRLLRIGEGLTLPLDAVTSTLLVYGSKGMGKTNLLSVVLEEMSAAALRWCSLDPIGVHWGLRHAADGRGDGVPCLILGGIHGDMPITPASGEIVADLVADEHVNVIIDCSRDHLGKMWSHGERTRSITAFIRRLYMRQGSLVDGQRRDPIFVALDEAARYIPQQIPHGNPDLAASLAAWEQLVEEGRNVGIGVGLFTQRSARLNKSVAELADAMLAFRTVGPNSIDAIIDWLGEHVPKADQRAMIEQVRKLPVGTALIVSPGWLEREGVVAIRARQTFDSSATPKPGERARRVVGSGATVDLDAYRKRMADVVEEAKANDAKALKAALAAAERDVGRYARLLTLARQALADRGYFDGTEIGEDVAPRIVELDNARCQEIGRLTAELAERPEPVGLGDDAVAIIQRVDAALIEVGDRIERERKYVTEALVQSGEAKVQKVRQRASNDAESASRSATRVAHEAPRPAAVPPPRATVPRPAAAPAAVGEHDTSLSGAARKILTALAQYGPRPAGKVAHLTGYSPAGAFSRTMTALRGSGYIEGSPLVTITPRGLGALGDYEPLPEGRALVDHWLGRLKGVEAKILTVLCEEYPDAMTPGEIAARTGYSAAGAFSRALTHLRKLDLVDGPSRGTARVNDEIGQAWNR
jgi:hypothetical protein